MSLNEPENVGESNCAGREEIKSESKEIASPKKTARPTKETWLKARIDYETGNYQGMRELAEKYGLSYKGLRDKAYHDDWKEFKSTTAGIIRQKIEEKAASKVESFFEQLEKKSLYYEKLVQASQSQASTNSEGIPQLEPIELEKYAKVEGMAIEWRKAALGITDKVDVTTGGKSLGQDLVSSVQKLYASLEGKEGYSKVLDVSSLREEAKSISNE